MPVAGRVSPVIPLLLSPAMPRVEDERSGLPEIIDLKTLDRAPERDSHCLEASAKRRASGLAAPACPAGPCAEGMGMAHTLPTCRVRSR